MVKLTNLVEVIWKLPFTRINEITFITEIKALNEQLTDAELDENLKLLSKEVFSKPYKITFS